MHTEFAAVVALYRAAGRPALENGCFEYRGEPDGNLQKAIEDVKDIPRAYGGFDGDIELLDDNTVAFRWAVLTNEKGAFYADSFDLVERSVLLSQGVFPEHFYLVKEDYLEGEKCVPPLIAKAKTCCEFIALLTRLALDHHELAGARMLFFVVPAGDDRKPRTVKLRTKLSRADLEANLNVRLLEEIMAEGDAAPLHASEHRQLLRSAVADVLADRDGVAEIGDLISRWVHVTKQYEYNADCYTQRFAFDKLKREVADASTEFAGKLSKVMGELATRALAIPVSLVGVAAITRRDGALVGDLIGVLAMLLVSLVVSGLIKNQLIEAGKVKWAFASVIQPLKRRPAITEAVAVETNRVEEDFSRQLRFLLTVLWTMRVITWLPPIMGTAWLIWERPEFLTAAHSWLHGALTLAMDLKAN